MNGWPGRRSRSILTMRRATSRSATSWFGGATSRRARLKWSGRWNSIRVRPTSCCFPPGPCGIWASPNKARRNATRHTVSIPRHRHFIQRFATRTIFLPNGTESWSRQQSVMTHGRGPTSWTLSSSAQRRKSRRERPMTPQRPSRNGSKGIPRPSRSGHRSRSLLRQKPLNIANVPAGGFVSASAQHSHSTPFRRRESSLSSSEGAQPPLRPLHLVGRETELCGQRLAGDYRRRMRENRRNSVRRPRIASLTDRNCEGFCPPGNRFGLPGLDGGGRSPAKPVCDGRAPW